MPVAHVAGLPLEELLLPLSGVGLGVLVGSVVTRAQGLRERLSGRRGSPRRDD
jgi:hypothetical protein